jgi:hypothetical protein
MVRKYLGLFRDQLIIIHGQTRWSPDWRGFTATDYKHGDLRSRAFAGPVRRLCIWETSEIVRNVRMNKSGAVLI